MTATDHDFRVFEERGSRLVRAVERPPLPDEVVDECCRYLDELIAYHPLDGEVCPSRLWGVTANLLSPIVAAGRYDEACRYLSAVEARQAQPDLLTVVLAWRGMVDNAVVAHRRANDGAGLADLARWIVGLARSASDSLPRWAAAGSAVVAAGAHTAEEGRWDEHRSLREWFQHVPAVLRGAVADDHARLIAEMVVLSWQVSLESTDGNISGGQRGVELVADHVGEVWSELLALTSYASSEPVRRNLATALVVIIETTAAHDRAVESPAETPAFAAVELPAQALAVAAVEWLRRLVLEYPEDSVLTESYCRALVPILEVIVQAGPSKLHANGADSWLENAMTPCLQAAATALQTHPRHVAAAVAVARACVNGYVHATRCRLDDGGDVSQLLSTIEQLMTRANAVAPQEPLLIEAGSRWRILTGRDIGG